uniref:Uncharacterized protein n=2 Tax=Tetranychus urticae TaxID=32264 RepID=T1KU86_TETUR
MASYEDLFKWMGTVDPLSTEFRMEVLRNIKFFRRIYLASLRFRADHIWAEESESGERMDEFDEEVMALPDPIEWDSLSENQQNMILGYITTIEPNYQKLQEDLIKEQPVPDLEKVMMHARFARYIYIQVNMIREKMASDEDFAKIYTFCLSDYSKDEKPPFGIVLDAKHPRAIARQRWEEYVMKCDPK